MTDEAERERRKERDNWRQTRQINKEREKKQRKITGR